MLHVFFGFMNPNAPVDTYHQYVPHYFDREYKLEWLFTDFSRELIRDVDKAEVQSDGTLRSLRTGDRFSPLSLSGGTKCALWLMYGYRGGVAGVSFGDNVAKYIERIGMLKDVWIAIHFDPQWEFIDPAGIHFIGQSEPAHDMDTMYDIFFDYMDQWDARMRGEDNDKS